MKTIHLSLGLILLSLVSCGTQPAQTLLRDFAGMDSIPLHATLFRQVENDSIFLPMGIIYFDSTLSIMNGNYRGGNYILNLIDLRNNHVLRGIRNGNGPKEIITLGSLEGVDSLIYAYDISRRIVYELNLNESRRRQDIIYDEYYRISTGKLPYLLNKFEQIPLMLHKINEGFLATGIFDEGAVMRINMNTNQYDFSGQFPEFQSTDRLSNFIKSMLYNNGAMMSVKPDQTRFVYAPMNAGYLAIYSLADDIRLIKEAKYFEPIFILRSDFEQPLSTEDTKRSALNIKSTDEYIYLLYSGKTLEIKKMAVGDYLLVYDWDGNPVRYYKLDVPLSSMDIDFENKTIYGIAYNPEGTVVKYELPEAE